ncbi:MAG TPA: CvpA family protein [Candidatus Polarisedimenticolaceae bacterium]|nr:CvpA family protein [Candidatus Polarisedimenticolaceae bacterium]
MNTFDIILLGFACALVVLGMLKGLVRILIGMAALVAAFALAARHHAGLAQRLSALEIGVEALRLLAYLLIFVGVMLAGGLVAWLLRRVLKTAMLGWADRLGGAALGLIAALLAAALVILPVVAYSPYGGQLLGNSLLAPYVSVVADVATRLAPADLSQRYRDKIEELRRHWRDRYVESLPVDPSRV